MDAYDISQQQHRLNNDNSDDDDDDDYGNYSNDGEDCENCGDNEEADDDEDDEDEDDYEDDLTWQPQGVTCGFFSGSASRREKDVGKPLKMIMTFDNEDDH